MITLKRSSFVTPLWAAFLLLQATFSPLRAAVTITITKDDNVPAATRKAAGDTVTYTNTISSTGTTDATGVQFKDPDVVHTSYVVDSLTATPVAIDDVYPNIVLANTSVDTSVGGFNVLTNDFYGFAGGDTTGRSSS